MPRSFDLKEWVQTLAHVPGVYRMSNDQGVVIYVGKAKSLKKRLASYTRKDLDVKTRRLVDCIAHVEVWETDTPEAALLLEHHLIKQYRPKYNILLKIDDKSYPFLLLSVHEDFPTLSVHRGKKKKPGLYFGPYANAYAMNQAMISIQKLFRLRTCSDAMFLGRSRPCMLAQIDRCTAPCVGRVTKEDYQQQVKLAKVFLKGDTGALFEHCMHEMNEAADAKCYEKAAEYRDIIRSLQSISAPSHGPLVDGMTCDVLAIAPYAAGWVVTMLAVHAGQVVHTAYHQLEDPLQDLSSTAMARFISEYYLTLASGKLLPKQIVVSVEIPEAKWLSEVLTEHSGHEVRVLCNPGVRYQKWLGLAERNAAYYGQKKDGKFFYPVLENEIWAAHVSLQKLEQVVCIDISHTQGKETVGSCVVFNTYGADKRAYRHINLDVTPGDDYAAIAKTVSTYIGNMLNQKDRWPDLLLIDGGKGQWSSAREALAALDCAIPVVAMAKGPERIAGQETYWSMTGDFTLPPESKCAQILQQIRDAAHHHAGYWHRKKRMKALSRGVMTSLPGVGEKRARLLLTHFGGMQGLKEASVEAITKVPGIGKKSAEKIYQALRDGS